ncbi:MAG: class I SAM-dependent methyltransferase, partial [Spirochaetes bacterium]|nr:class I SAM-dependent methyltransferase [Spirochaetota bacterium]
KYFLDMQKVARKSYDMLKPDGMALYVIGNTEYKGVRIDNAKHLAESLFSAGFRDVRTTKRKISNKILTPFRDNLGKFSSDSSGRKVYSEEFILIGRK